MMDGTWVKNRAQLVQTAQKNVEYHGPEARARRGEAAQRRQKREQDEAAGRARYEQAAHAEGKQEGKRASGDSKRPSK